MIKKKSIVFFGNERLSSAIEYDQAPIMQTLITQNYNIEALIIKNKHTRSRSLRQLAILGLASRNNLNIIEVKNNEDLRQAVKKLHAELAVLASFGLILTEEILQHFPLGIVNIHPSLLPIYRGPTPIEHALLNGDTETGISLMNVSRELDAGDIYMQKKLSIQEHESKLSLTQRLGLLAAQMLDQNLPLIMEKNLKMQPQDHRKATYSKAIRAQVLSDFQQYPASYLERYIRAFQGCPNNKFHLNEMIVEIKSARAMQAANLVKDISYDRQQKLLYIRCQKDYLAVNKLQPAGRREMTASDFVNGFCQELLED